MTCASSSRRRTSTSRSRAISRDTLFHRQPGPRPVIERLTRHCDGFVHISGASAATLRDFPLGEGRDHPNPLVVDGATPTGRRCRGCFPVLARPLPYSLQIRSMAKGQTQPDRAPLSFSHVVCGCNLFKGEHAARCHARAQDAVGDVIHGRAQEFGPRHGVNHRDKLAAQRESWMGCDPSDMAVPPSAPARTPAHRSVRPSIRASAPSGI